MHDVKANKMAAQNNLRAEMMAKEESNRMKIREHRKAVASNISNNKQSVFTMNKNTRHELGAISNQIRDNIQNQRAKSLMDKESNFKQIYDLKQKAAQNRAHHN